MVSGGAKYGLNSLLIAVAYAVVCPRDELFVDVFMSVSRSYARHSGLQPSV